MAMSRFITSAYRVAYAALGRSLFVNIQHRGGDGRDATYAIQKISPTNFRTTAPTN